jgi:hypothetical protein
MYFRFISSQLISNSEEGIETDIKELKENVNTTPGEFEDKNENQKNNFPFELEFIVPEFL